MNEPIIKTKQEAEISTTIQLVPPKDVIKDSRYLFLEPVPAKVSTDKYVGLSIEEIERRYGRKEAVGVYQHVANGGDDPTDPKKVLPVRREMISTVIVGFSIHLNSDDMTSKIGVWIRDWDRNYEWIFDCTIGHHTQIKINDEFKLRLASMAITDLGRRWRW